MSYHAARVLSHAILQISASLESPLKFVTHRVGIFLVENSVTPSSRSLQSPFDRKIDNHPRSGSVFDLSFQA
jgi:hypothetical protein